LQLTSLDYGATGQKAVHFSTAESVTAIRKVVMAGNWGDESKVGDVAVNTGGSMPL
jgi:hypothetical protein